MRDVLLKRVRKLAERFADDLAGVVVDRVEADLAHIGQILEYSLSAIASDLGHPAFASEESHGDSDRRDDDPVPHVRRRPRRKLHDDDTRGQGRTASRVSDREGPRPAQAAEPGRADGQRPARLVADPLEDVLGPDLVGMMKPGVVRTAAQPAAVERPRIVPTSAPLRGQSTDKPRRDIDKVTTSGKERVRPPRSCAKCGEIGRRSDTCGITHNVPGKDGGPARSAATPNRIAAIASRAQRAAPDHGPIATAGDEEPVETLAAATTRAEANKHSGVMPRPRSTFAVERSEVQELDFGAEG